MTSLDDLPQRDTSHDTEEAAEVAFHRAVETCSLFVVQRADRKDYGTDVQIEARDGGVMTNIRAHVQLKGTRSAEKARGVVRMQVSRINLNYLLLQANSLYICYHLPSDRLFVRSADDVYREYEHIGGAWASQSRVTITFTQLFDEDFQRCFNARLLAAGRASRDRRLEWAAAPPEQIPALIQNSPITIEVSSVPSHAKAMLAELYAAGHDLLISRHFAQFAAVLDSWPGAMDLAYMAEVNLGLNGSPFHRERVLLALEVFRAAADRGDTHLGSLLYCMGNAWLALKDYEKAQSSYVEALALLSGPGLSGLAAQCQKNLGTTFAALGKMEEARARYELALELDPNLGEAHLALAFWHRKIADDHCSALRHLDQVIPRGGSSIQLSMVQGWRIELLFLAGETNGAFRELSSLLGEASRLEWVWPWCARQVARFGRVSIDAAKLALQFWCAYLQAHPESCAAERQRLQCLLLLRSAGEPTRFDYPSFKRAGLGLIESGDSDPAYLWDRIGHWAQYDGDWGEAEGAYRKAYELDPQRYGYCLGTALNFLLRHEEALPILLAQAEVHLPDAPSWFQVAVARTGIGDIDGGISAYKRTLDIDADHELAWFNLGGLYWNSQDVTRAAETWREAVTRFPDHELARTVCSEWPEFF